MPRLDGLLATRRPRSHEEERIWAAHVVSVEGETVGAPQYETDRARFLGRGRTIRNPTAIHDGHPLSNTVGPVLDPIFSLHRRVRLAPGATARITFTTLAGRDREALLAAADKFRDTAAFERTATLAWTQAQVQLRHLGISADEAHLFQRLATRVLYFDPTLRASPELLQRNTRGASALWAHGISGDVPIVLLRIDHSEDREIVRQLLRAHHYWRMKGLAVDLVIVNEQAHSYAGRPPGRDGVARPGGASRGGSGPAYGRGSIFVLKGESPRPRDPGPAACGFASHPAVAARRAWPSRSSVSCGPSRPRRARRGPSRRCSRRRRGPPAAAGARVLQRPRGLRSRRAGST